MKFLKSSAQKHGFRSSHLGLLVFLAAVLIGASYMKDGLGWLPHFAQSDNTPQYTYEQALQEAEASVPQVPVAEMQALALAKQQLADVDPTSGGKVLGAETSQFDVDSALSDEALAKIPVNINKQKVPSLAEQAGRIKIITDMVSDIGLLSALSTTDVSALQKTQTLAIQAARELAAVPVGGELSRYVKLKILTYQNYATLADSLSGSSPEVVNMSLLIPLSDAAESERSAAAQRWGIDL
jgi:hypothetical protein